MCIVKRQCSYSLFSKMKWLDEEIEINKHSEGRNNYSDWYYAQLAKIRDAQQNGTITDEMYGELGDYEDEAATSYGYFTSNIHYDFYNNYEDKDELEDRILQFLKTSDVNMLKNRSWFSKNFITSFVYYLSRFVYQSRIEHDDPIGWIIRNGSEKEVAIVKAITALKQL